MAGAQADAAAAQSSLQTAKEKITELTDCLDLANTSYEQTAKELQQQHAHDLQVRCLTNASIYFASYLYFNVCAHSMFLSLSLPVLFFIFSQGQSVSLYLQVT